MKKYHDVERDSIVTEKDLFAVWYEMYSNMEIDIDFKAYVNDCLGKNGTLELMH